MTTKLPIAKPEITAEFQAFGSHFANILKLEQVRGNADFLNQILDITIKYSRLKSCGGAHFMYPASFNGSGLLGIKSGVRQGRAKPIGIAIFNSGEAGFFRQCQAGFITIINVDKVSNLRVP